MSENRPGGSFERASKISHSHIINDIEIREYLSNCAIPVESKDVDLNLSLLHNIHFPSEPLIEHVIIADGEDTTIPVKKNFPSSLVTFFQFGTLLMKMSDLKEMEQKPFVSPSDIQKLKKIKREKLVVPIKNVSLKKEDDLKTSVRKAIQTFFSKVHSGKSSMLTTLHWFIFELYDTDSSKSSHPLSQCPHCGTSKIILEKNKMNPDTFSWECIHQKCKKEILITDYFRLFEIVDNETGALGILPYTNNLIQTFLIIHTIKSILEIENGLIDKFIFIKDGPLSFAGETAGMHKPMQKLINFLSKTNKISIVGVEKSGPFVDHAKEIKDKINPNQVLLFNNKHIYSYVIPGEIKNYASTSYYSGKFMYKSPDNRIYVLTMPVEDHNLYYEKPELSDLKNIHEILYIIDKLKCDVYENALIPVALANKLISLSNHPSSNILEKFAKKSMGI